MEEISLELERVVPVGAKVKNHNELEGLGFEESGHIGFASSEELNATKESLQSQIDTNANAIQALSEGIDPEKIDGIKDLIDYVEEHQVDVVSIQEGIEKNASDIDDLEGSVSSIGERVTALEESGSSTEPSGEPLVATFQITSANTEVTAQYLQDLKFIDWGDGTPIEEIDYSTQKVFTHTYETTGVKTAKFYGFTAMSSTCFDGQKTLLSVVIPPPIKAIGSSVFRECTILETVDLPYTLVSIGEYAFNNCSKLKTINLENITTLGMSCFSGCSELSVLIVNKKCSVGIGAFSGCTSLINATFNNGGSFRGSFNNATNLKTLTILGEKASLNPSHTLVKEGVKIIVPSELLNDYKTDENWSTYASQIDSYALVSELGEGGGDTEELEKRVDNLELLHQDPLVATFNITKASTALTIKNLTGATMVDWGDGSEIEDISATSTYTHTYETTGTYEARFYGKITSIGQSAFYTEPRQLTNLYIPKTVVSIGSQAVDSNADLKVVKFAYNSGLIEISDKAFNNCTGLLSINMPQSAKKMGTSAFSGCQSLAKIELPDMLQDKYFGLSIFKNCYALSTIVFPTGLSILTNSVFLGCKALNEIVIPKSIKTIEVSAFALCEALKDVHIYIGSNIQITSPFSGCYNLQRVILDNIQEENKSTSITLTGKIFTDKGTTYSNDRVLEIRSDTPPTITGIEYIQDDIKIIVPKSSLELYKNADGWKDKASQIDCEITANDVYALVGNINTELANLIEGEGV